MKYEIPGFIEKPANALNKFKAKGSVLKNGGILIDNWSYELGGNQVSGTAKIQDINNLEFIISLASDNFQMHPSGQFFSFLDAEMDGTTNFNITGSGNLNKLQDSIFEGEMKLKGLKIRPKNFLSPLTVNASLRFKEGRLDIRSGKISSDKSDVKFTGVYQRGDVPSLDLNVTGEGVNMDDFLPEPQSKEASLLDLLNNYEFFTEGKGKIKFQLDKLNYKLFSLDHVHGTIALDNRKIEMKDLVFSSYPSVISGGQILIDAQGVSRVESSIKVQDMVTKNLFSFFGKIFEDSLSGKVKTLDAQLKGSGKDWKEIFMSLYGSISVDIQSGSINQEKLKRGIRRLFSSISQQNPLDKETSSPFKQISGDFVAKGNRRSKDLHCWDV